MTLRLHNCSTELTRVHSVEQEQFGTWANKPRGLWYGIGDEWLDWCKGEMPEWIKPHWYRLEVDESKLLILSKPSDIEKFTRRFGIRDRNTQYPTSARMDTSIVWAKVAQKYAGIEINPYMWECRNEYVWYYGWDVASGCIWNDGAVTGITQYEKIIFKPH